MSSSGGAHTSTVATAGTATADAGTKVVPKAEEGSGSETEKAAVEVTNEEAPAVGQDSSDQTGADDEVSTGQTEEPTVPATGSSTGAPDTAGGVVTPTPVAGDSPAPTAPPTVHVSAPTAVAKAGSKLTGSSALATAAVPATVALAAVAPVAATVPAVAANPALPAATTAVVGAAAPVAASVPTPTVTGLVTRMLTALFSPLIAPAAPTAPAPAPIFLAVLSWVRREIQRTFFNQAPIVAPQQLGQDLTTGLVNGTLNASDPDGDPLTYAVSQGPANGTVVLSPQGTYVYTPSATLARTGGTDTFTVAVADTGFHVHGLVGLLTLGIGGHASTATVTVTVAPVTGLPNRAPVAGNDTASTTAGVPVTVAVLGNDSDPDGDPLTVSSTTTPAHGTVVRNAGGTLTYTPTAGYVGADAFSYTIADGRGATATAAVNVIVAAAPNRAPVAVNDTASTTAGVPVTVAVLANDTDPDGNPVTVASVGVAAHGAVVRNANGTVTYTPTAGYVGADAFNYTISDGKGATATAAVNVTVAAAPTGDSTAALQAKFDALKPGDTLTLDPGVYLYSDNLYIRTSNVTVKGNGTTLQSTNPDMSALVIQANNVSLSNLTLSAPTNLARNDSTNRSRLVFGGTGNKISDVSIIGGASAGVFITGASNFQLDRVSVQGTAADGVQITNGSNNGVLNNVSTLNTGDDAIAIVSYQVAPQLTVHDITINNPVVRGGGQRGLVVVGGNAITFNNIDVADTALQAVFIGSQGAPFYTQSTTNVHVNGGTVTRGGKGGLPFGAVAVYSQAQGQTVSGVLIENLTLVDTPATAYSNVILYTQDGGTVSDIVFRNIAIRQLIPTVPLPFYASGATSDTYTTTGFTVNGVPVNPSPLVIL